MSEKNTPLEDLLRDLKERAKELNCLYEVNEVTNKTELSVEEILRRIVEVIPPGWQYPHICHACITYDDQTYRSTGFTESSWVQSATIVVQEEAVGSITVCYSDEMPAADEGPFLKEERKLLENIADRLGQFLLHRRLGELFHQHPAESQDVPGWRSIVDLLKKTNPQLLLQISRRMTNHLIWNGSREAAHLLTRLGSTTRVGDQERDDDPNRPHPKEALQNYLPLTDEIFGIALDYMGERETLMLMQKWIKEDRSTFLVNVLENPATSHAEIADALNRYRHLDPEGSELADAREMAFRVALIRRFLTDQPQTISVSKQFIEMRDFYDLLPRIIYPGNSQGKLGGKSAGLLLASQILKRAREHASLLNNLRIPKTWYITSDGILSFIHHNNLEDIIDQKYKDIGQVRQEYPYVLQVFKNSQFPPELMRGLALALDDFGSQPLIVRSSSLLEDRMGTAFAGKYKSLFIANQGSKEERLAALTDAVAEVYASVFSPDPIEYRAEHGLMDYHEEMGIMIQEVVGKTVGDYFLPAYAGVAFSNNEFRWSPRIRPEDGLVRLVPGLGTRAVDRIADDYPILIAPGQPGLRVNISIDEIVRYSPKKVDVINLKTNSFETIDIEALLKKCGRDYPGVQHLVSLLDHDHVRHPMGKNIDFDKETIVVTFEGLKSKTPFVKEMHAILVELQQKLGTPVDIEFASDGESFYLLQCRPQSYGMSTTPATIPQDIPKERLLFSANRYVSNGTVVGISHIVYVDPQKYSELGTRKELQAVGRAVSRLNQVLPKRRFILMGPGRWGSRGDIKLGVNVTYSDINNTAMLIEVARKKGNYVPDLSFGTHFFQDLVEESIRYLPLYPDDAETVLNDEFISSSENVLGDLVPDFAPLSDVIRVIDVPRSSNGLVLDVLMNAELNRAVGMLADLSTTIAPAIPRREYRINRKEAEDHWRWRLRMVEEIAAQMDAQRFGVEGLYVFGSVKNANAGPGSDIDLIVHFRGTKSQQQLLTSWLEGWSFCLSELNFWRTGVKTDGLLDVHLVTDEDIKKRTSYAVKIGAVTDPARKLPLGRGD